MIMLIFTYEMTSFAILKSSLQFSIKSKYTMFEDFVRIFHGHIFKGVNNFEILAF